MTRRAFALSLCAVSFLLLALAFGHSVYFLLAFFLLITLLFSLVTILVFKCTLRMETALKQKQVRRGENLHLTVSVKQKCPFPAGLCTLTLQKGRETEKASLILHPFREDLLDCTMPARHVGSFGYGALELTVYDVFCLFTLHIRSAEVPQALVLPNPFEIEKPAFVMGEEGLRALARTQEDPTSPEDVRGYVAGDPMKRIHWKLSARKRELLVRRFETPEPPDTLILLNQTLSDTADGTLSGQDTLRDLLCETCCAVANQQLKDRSPVRVPFYGAHPGEFSSDDPSRLLLLEQMLAMQPFSGEDAFERILRLELRRMRRTGAVLVLTSQMNAALTDGIIALRKMGPSVRVYVVSLKTDEEALQPYVDRLQHHLAEVCYVTPA